MKKWRVIIHNNKSIIEVQGITKTFSGVVALNNVDFDVRAGEVHALVGENGAGKSTLSKIIAGVVKPDKGKIKIMKEGQEQEIKPQNSKEVLEMRISIIYQEFNLIPVLSIADNIFLGREHMKNIFIDEVTCNAQAEEIIRKVGLNCSPRIKVSELSVAEQQLVEIAKALSYKTRVLIMDEPTASLMAGEIERLFTIIKSLKKNGVAIIYVSHKLEEIFAISERITVLKDGNKIGTYWTEELNQNELIALMVGRKLINIHDHSRTNAIKDEIVLKVEGLTRLPKLKDISFELRRGEILGIAGLVGAGRTELVKTLFGIDPIQNGSVTVFGEKVRKIHPNVMVQCGLGFIPEDRKQDGVIHNMSVKENITLGIMDKICKNGLICNKDEIKITEEIIRKLNIKCLGLSHQLGNLSGGNQQKVVLAKWLVSNIRILIMDEPTRGIDVGAKFEIYLLMHDLCEQGLSIIMVSSELPEILGISDRILVMSEGEITGELLKEDADEETIIKFASLRRKDGEKWGV